MMNFLKSNWIVITAFLVYSLVAGGVAAWMIRSNDVKAKAELQNLADELQTTQESSKKTALELAKLKTELGKEKLSATQLAKQKADADREIETLRKKTAELTAEVDKQAAAAKQAAVKKPASPSRGGKSCDDGDKSKQEEANKRLYQELQDFQAALAKRDAELRERQRKLDEEKKQIEQQRKKEQSEYKWPR